MNHEEELKRLLADFSKDSGFKDQYGYIVHQTKEKKDDVMKPDELGEATLYTAIAAIAIATGNYKQDDWDKNSANKSLMELLTTLLEKGWGNKDNLGRYHPIRHPEDIEYYKYGNDVKSRISPITKDSFGAIVAASYYSYSCPNSSQEVRKLARDLMTKWSEYLILFQWRTHSIYIDNEFEKDENDKKRYKNIFSDKNLEHLKTFKGPGSFMLLPHEIYALQNVAAHLGIATSQWDARDNMTPELKQTFIDLAVPYIAQYAGQAIDNLLQSFKGAVPYSIPLGPPDWSLGKINGVFTLEIPSSIREQIVTSFKEAIKDLLREKVRLDNYQDYQGDELLGILINRVLDLFPDVLGPDSWRSILTKSIQQVLPWITKSGWIEALTFIGSLQLLKPQSISSISYTLWIYAVECETRPEMKDLLKAALEEFYSYLRGNDNPNSLWAWIAEDSGRVSEHLQLFESKDWNYWWRFAYQEDKFNDWLKKPEDQSNEIINQNECNNSPRLDYLVLSGLAEKGPPVGLTDILSDWWEDFMKLIGDVANQFINNLTAEIQKQFTQTGYYIQEKLNEAGELIKETWSNTLEYTHETFFQGNLIRKSTWNPAGVLIHKWDKVDGKVIEEFWHRTGESYWKGVWSETGDMLERITHPADGIVIEEFWKRTGENYWKGVWSKVDGTADDMIERVIHPIDGTLIHEYWKRTGENYWKGIWSNVDGAMENMIERIIHPIDGTLIHEYWKRDGENYWKGVWSKVDGAAENMIERVIHPIDGTLIHEYWKRDGEKYWKGVWSKVDGAAENMIERIIEGSDGTIEKVIWDGAGKSGRTVWNAAGEVIERVGDLFPDLRWPPNWSPF
ncbi:hypothetical protein J2D69_02890 [Lysinibacillus sphaericus]|uniref:Uncharacterized protein n=3 Tax=Lysinibacillus TaxID=400634 RepID=B1HMD4_LYSSC|nr:MULTISPECIES: hypothetical protein [Lysinibacillus]MBE5082100.1 hypothetical protein [Bacillus thuringiensis]ACA38706.1 hypothetical protein Bsph_1096 [Lysinibacillus sphaericus C3-41]AMO31037.1 hypothetical protein AR327_00075 [Lysinibacillus sphaericus]AMR89856.1 hypothetical protein A1T07_06600 [Lysinibacillus sphaericus]ANA47926.1 hypothetical protein A2J09_21800 [Lysinibacillus sphaericus]